MFHIREIGSAYILTFAVITSSVFMSVPPANSQECSSDNGHAICLTKEKTPQQNFARKGTLDTRIDSPTAKSSLEIEAENQRKEEEFRRNYDEVKDNLGQPMYIPKGNARKQGEAECLAAGRQPGKYSRIREMPISGEEVNYDPKTGLGTYCQPLDTKTLTSNDPAQPKGPTIEEMLQEVEDQFAKTDIQAPVLKQSYNLGSGQGEDNPNVYKNQAVNFYVDAPTARWEGDLMIGHVEMESYPTQMTIQYGNGDEGSFYTMGKPVSRARGEESRKTATSYVYKRSGNFHAYATVSYSGRFRVNGGDWQALDVVLTKETVDPLLIRVWWVDVGRVAGDCSYDDTRWGCKNDPTMGKKDNPNPRLRKADIRTGQRWHLNDSGDGDTEYSLHRDWPDM